MALKLSVKIGDVTNLSDARYAAGMGVDYIGFNINPESEHFVTPEVFNEITNWISGVNIIGEVGENIPDDSNGYGSYLPETSSTENIQGLEHYVLRIDTSSTDTENIESIINSHNAEFYILESSPKWIIEHKTLLSSLSGSSKIYLSSDFEPSLLELVVNEIKIQGIEIKGGLEDQPGFKDYDGIADVLEWLEID